jgi:hypothetical protein
MTDDQFAQWTEESGIDLIDRLFHGDIEQLQSFANLVRNAAIEEAAVKCDEQADRARTSSGAARADACADQIRSMKS